MKILLGYLKPHKWLVLLTLLLASINVGFSLVDPILLGKLINLAGNHRHEAYSNDRFSIHSPGTNQVFGLFWYVRYLWR
ncbi:MAG: hypothetical protein U0T68_10350 [Ferruginibacter sp.]